MADILAVPLKKTSELDLIKPLKNIVSLRFSTADNPENFSDGIVELNKLRNSATIRTLDKQEASIEIIARYCDQLACLECKIPPQDVQIPFKWKDAFDKGSLFSGKMSMTMSSLAYERMCSLFNLAAFQSQVAAVQNIETDEGLKLAAKLLQHAATIFTYIKGSVMAALQQEPTPDLNPETLSALAALMLAEAQEMFVLKAINNGMKEAIIAKLAAQCEDYYAEALRSMQRDLVRSMWDREWIPKVTSKQSAYLAISQYYQARVCSANKVVGEEIARLQHALELFKTAQQRSADPTQHQTYMNQAQRYLTEAQKDNDFIYHERVPEVKSLSPIGRGALAKISAMPEHLSSGFKDLFQGLTPVAVHQALAAWEGRKMEIVNVEVGRLRETTQQLNGVLASLNLPAALEESAGESLPQSLKEKARTVRQAGGIGHVHHLISELPSLFERNKEILDEAERLLNEENESDSTLRAQFQERWSRTPSTRLTEAFISNITKYRQILTNASNADDVVRTKFDANKRGVEMLSRPEDELETAVPSASQFAADNSRSPAADQLRLLMAQVDDIKSQREQMEQDLKSVTIDMKAQFLAALAQDGAVNEPAMSVEKLGEVYGPLQRSLRETIDFQAALIDQIQHLNEEFSKDRAGNKGASSREELLKELAAAHDVYMEVQNNLEEGTKFYNDLTQLLLSFQSKITDFCFARKAEKEELLKSLTSSLATAGSAAPPNPPAHHANREAPSRPPPPNFGAQPAAPPAAAPPANAAPGAPPNQGQQAPYVPYPLYTYGMPMPYYPPVQGDMQRPQAPNYEYVNPAAPAASAPVGPAAPGQYPGYPSYPYPYYPPAGYPYPPPRPQW